MNLIKTMISKTARLFGYKFLPADSVISQGTLFDDCMKFFSKDDELIILDVGASHGAFSELAIRRFPNANIFAFEPQNRDFIILKKNLSRYNNITAINKALSDKTGEQTMFITRESQSSSLLKSKGNIFSEQENVGIDNIETITLEDWFYKEEIEFIDILKLDVQGYELKILESSEKILDKISLIYSEIHFLPQYIGSTDFFELSNFLFSKDFISYNIYDIRRIDKRAVFSDALYVKKELLSSLK